MSATGPAPAGGSPAAPPAGPQPSGLGLNPVPVPTEFDCAQTQMANGEVAIVLRVRQPQGMMTYFLPADTAAQLGEIFTKLAGPAKAGLIVSQSLQVARGG